MVSAMTVDDLVPHYLGYRAKYHPSEEMSPDDARAQLESFVAAEDFEELSNRPRIIPLQEARQYLVQVQQKQDREKQQQHTGSRRARSMHVLVENGLVTAGERIFLRHSLPDYMSYDPQNPVYHATITGKLGRQNTVRWEHDGQEYSISGLTWNIFRDLHPEKKNPSGINGPWYWTNAEGTALWFLAENHVRPAAPAAEPLVAADTGPEP